MATSAPRPKPSEKLSTKDNNSDGLVDYELHHFPGMADADWVLIDTNHDGTFDKKITYGYAVVEESLSIPVPKK